jgi:hypothetical protein
VSVLAYRESVPMRWHGRAKRRSVLPQPSRSGFLGGQGPLRRWWGPSLSAAPKWSIGLTALVGAWVGHFVEYVRVAGWHVGLAEMGSSVHSYFFPAGAALIAVVVGMVVLARQAWRRLGARIRAAEVGLWKRPKTLPPSPVGQARGAVGVAPLWLALAFLQTATWVTQENLEALGGGHRAPLLAVVSGAHWLAPVVQAEVALSLAAVYSLVQHWFGRRRSQLVARERLVARRWSPRQGFQPVAVRVTSVPSTPLERWGKQRWQRPPPTLVPTV